MKKEFKAISNQRGSIGYEMVRSHLINTLIEALHSNSKEKAITIVDRTMKRSNLSRYALDKYEEYRSFISNMDILAAIRYSSNFCKKGFSTYLPVGSFK